MATLDGIIEPIYFLITSISFILLSAIQYKKFRKTREKIYLTGLSVFFMQLYCYSFNELNIEYFE